MKKRNGTGWTAIYTIVFCLTCGIVFGLHYSEIDSPDVVAPGTGPLRGACGPEFATERWVEVHSDFLRQHPKFARECKRNWKNISTEAWLKAGFGS